MKFAKRVLAGAAAGLAGGMAMRVLVKAWERRHGGLPEHGPFGLDREADREGAVLLWQQFTDAKLSDAEAEFIGAAFHFLLSGAAGAGYLLLPGWARRGRGLPYGLAVWLFGDLLAVSLSGVSDPSGKTLDSHAVALTAHLVYGGVLDGIAKRCER